ncbi:MAG: hypothetical protein ABFD13_00350 [Candidatus Cryosericum sp.]|nr:hypothetical protein [bacterium]
MMRMDVSGNDVSDEELAVVIAAALAASRNSPDFATAVDPSSLDDSSMAAVLAAIAASGVSLRQEEAPLPCVHELWRRPTYEQSVRPRWR